MMRYRLYFCFSYFVLLTLLSVYFRFSFADYDYGQYLNSIGVLYHTMKNLDLVYFRQTDLESDFSRSI